MMVIMTFLRSIYLLLPVLLLCLFASSPAVAAVSFEIFTPDSSDEVVLANMEHFYLGINYKSDVPVRFRPEAYNNQSIRAVGAHTSTANLHAAGEDKALTWIAFDNPTHIDEVIITAYDEAWSPLATDSIKVNAKWNSVIIESPKEPVEWVQALQKKERVKRDYLFDSSPKPPDVASDTLFVLCLLSIPLYIFLQIRMLRRYRLRWRELATVPLITALPITVYALSVGIGFNLRLWPPFVMYFSLFACLYLLTLWVIKKIKS
jgi:hypothetical protein